MAGQNITYDQLTKVAKDQMIGLRNDVAGKDQNYVFAAKACARGVYRVWDAFSRFAPSVAMAADDNAQFEFLIDSFDSLLNDQNIKIDD